MSDTYNHSNKIENLVNALFRAYQDNKITTDELAESVDCLQRSIKQLKKLVEGFEKPLKSLLATQDTVVINNRKYYFKTSTSKVFDTDKAKATLESLAYSLEDFTKLQAKQTLVFDLNK